jgi:hypothetical protein
MLSELLDIIGLSPSVIYSALRTIDGVGQARTVMLRMLPPERRPSTDRVNRSTRGGKRGTDGDSMKHSVKLWTLRDCQMELLTEGTTHAFDASATPYVPDRRSSNYPPSRVPQRAGFYLTDDADVVSHLLRTLERRADMLAEGAPEVYRNGPHVEDGQERMLSYVGRPPLSENQTVNQ